MQGSGTNGDPYSILLNPEIRQYIGNASFEVDVIRTKSKTRIPVVIFRTPGAAYTLIVSHGNATDLGYMLPMLAQMAVALRVNIVGYDYSGYGTATGTATDKQTYKDIDAVYKWCLAKVEGARIILYGQSVGSGPTCYLAAGKRRESIAGVILHSPILSGVRVLTESPGVLSCFDIFPNIKRIGSVMCPVFIMHGTEDVEVRFHHGTRLHDAVPERFRAEPWWVPRRGHNDMIIGHEAEYFRRLRFFLESVTNNTWHVRQGPPLQVDKRVNDSVLLSYMNDHPLSTGGDTEEMQRMVDIIASEPIN